MTEQNLSVQTTQLSVTNEGASAFAHLHVTLPAGASIHTQPGALASMDDGVDLHASLNGGIIGALLLKFLGKESIFLSQFKNKTSSSKRLVLTQPTPGQIVSELLNNESLYLQAGAFLACTPGVSIRVKWAGFSSWFGGEGLFRLRAQGVGQVWYGAFGAVVERELNGTLIVDSGHLLSYPSTVTLSLGLAGGIFSSFFGGEGLVLKLRGRGKIRLQTRSIEGFAHWLNRYF